MGLSNNLPPRRKPRPGMLAAAAALGLALPASAATSPFADPPGDFLAGTYTGPQNADLDIVSGSAQYTATHVKLSLTLSGSVGSSPTPYYLWGVNRGSGTDRLLTSGPPPVGPPTVLFDTVVRMDFDGNGRVVTFASANSPPVITLLAPSVVKIAGNTVSAEIPWALLPSTGFAPQQYTYIAWTRSAIGSQEFIADLAPDARTVSAVPEPASWAMATLGLLATGIAVRRRRERTAPAAPTR